MMSCFFVRVHTGFGGDDDDDDDEEEIWGPPWAGKKPTPHKMGYDPFDQNRSSLKSKLCEPQNKTLMFLMFLLFSQKLGETHGQAHHLHTKTFTVLQSMVKSLEELHAAQSGWFAETLSTVGDFKFLALIIHP